MNSIDQLKSQAIDKLLTLRHASDKDMRNDILKDVAEDFFELRSLHTTAAGEADWRGKTYDYRSLVRDIYAEAGLSSDPNDKTKAMLRYWLAELIHTRLSGEDIAAVGLLNTPPSMRQTQRNRQQSALAAQARHLVYTIQRQPDYVGTDTERQAAQNIVQILSRWLAN